MCRPITAVLVTLVSTLLVTAMTSSVPEKRIINGEEAEKASHPYIVSLQWFAKKTNSTDADDDANWFHFCGGVLIDRNWVLTAAHCVDHIDDENEISKFRVKLGEHHLSEPSKWEYSLGVKKVVQHPWWCRCAAYNDLALLRLETPARTGCNVQLATLSEDDAPYVYSDCVLAGWGRISTDSYKGALVLQEVNMTHIPNDLCASMMKKKFVEMHGEEEELFVVRGSNICAFDISPDPVHGHGSACHGDSGGPMMCGDDRSVLVGITSWGPHTCDGVNVYTRVSRYMKWIKNEIDRDLHSRG